MKMLEHVEEGLIRQRVEIDEMQCGFMLECGIGHFQSIKTDVWLNFLKTNDTIRIG